MVKEKNIIDDNEKAKVVLTNFLANLEEPGFFLIHHIPPVVAYKIREIIKEMMNSPTGKILKGRKSLDGYTMPICPKHENSPLYICLECEYYNGKDTQNGLCVAPERRHPKEKNYTYYEAKAMQEDWMREKAGLPKEGRTFNESTGPKNRKSVYSKTRDQNETSFEKLQKKKKTAYASPGEPVQDES